MYGIYIGKFIKIYEIQCFIPKKNRGKIAFISKKKHCSIAL